MVYLALFIHLPAVVQTVFWFREEALCYSSSDSQFKRPNRQRVPEISEARGGGIYEDATEVRSESIPSVEALLLKDHEIIFSCLWN
jgi:hypothetical protein